MLPVAALGVVMYAYYIGFANIGKISTDVRISLMTPYREFMELFSEDVEHLLFNYVLDFGGSAVPEVICVYLGYRMFLGITTGQLKISNWKVHLFYITYTMLLWLPFWVGFMTFMNAGD